MNLSRTKKMFVLVIALSLGAGIPTLNLIETVKADTLISEGFESGIPSGWVNTGWLWNYYGIPHSGSGWIFSWAAGDTLTTPSLTFGEDTQLSFWYAAESGSNAMSLDVMIDGSTLIYQVVNNVNTNYQQAVVDLSAYDGAAHTISFIGMTSGFYGQTLDDILISSEFYYPPVVSDIPDQTINEGSTFTTIPLDDYVTDPDNTDAEMTWTYTGNSALTVSIVNRVATITTPNADWYGTETITFRATDPDDLFDEDAAVFTVLAVNDPPVVGNIPDQTINEGSSFAAINLDTYVTDVDNSDAQMTWTYSGNSALTVSIVNRVATITTPNADWYGAETVTFRATDPDDLFDEDAAVFTVLAVNDQPVVSGIPDQTITEGSSFTTINLDTYVTDVDNTDAQMIWTYSGNSALTVSIVNRVATITIPNAEWCGVETITFRATDPGGLFGQDAAVFTVTCINDPPSVTDIPDQTINEGANFATIILDNYVTDVDNTDAEMTWTYSGNVDLTVSIVNRVATITTPDDDWYGTETITFRATDPGGLYDEDAAVFTVISVDDFPFSCYTWVDADGTGTGTVINFNAGCSTDDEGITLYEWDWTNDGTYDYTGGPTATHDYGDADLHTCALRVTDTIGQTDVFTDIVQAIIGEEALDVDQSTYNRNFPIRHTTDGDWGGAQNFTPEVNTITKVELYLRKMGSPEFDLSVELREDDPEGTLLDTVTIPIASVPETLSWLSVDIDDVIVGAGSDIFIVCPPAPLGVTTSFGYEWGYALGNQYDGGAFWFTRDGGNWWRDLPTMYEFCFRTYGY